MIDAETADASARLQARVDAHPFWYHVLDVVPGVRTDGWFDLRHVFDVAPFPDVRGKRCLDIGTFDGFYAFEMARRGASEVVAIDLPDHEDWDWPADARRGGPEYRRDPAFAGPAKGAGFALVRELTGLDVDWRPMSVYDLSPDDVGSFDVVVMGSLLIHLQNPIAALEAARSVCVGQFFSCDQIELWPTVLARRHPYARLRGTGHTCQWWLYNSAAHRQMLFAAGFRVVEQSGFLNLRYAARHGKPGHSARELARRFAQYALTRDRNQGVLHRAILAEPRLDPAVGRLTRR